MNPESIQEEFNKGIIMPPKPEMIEEEVEETPEHPNAPLLDNLLETMDAKSSETNDILESILIQLSNESELETAENQLQATDKLVEEIKSLKEIIKDNNKWEVNLILE